MNFAFLFFIFSFLGYVWEVIIYFFMDGTFVNRGVLFGPWLPIYGTGSLLIILLLKRFRKNPMLLFMLSALLCGSLEYASAWYLETFRNAKWWDYSECLFNIQGRICLGCVALFGVGGCLLIYLLEPAAMKVILKIPVKLRKILCFVLIGCFLTDLAFSLFHPNQGAGITVLGLILQMLPVG